MSLNPYANVFRARTYRTLLFLLLAAPIGVATLGVLIAGWTAAGVLAITPLVVPALLAFRLAIGLLARLDGGLARGFLGVDVPVAVTSGGRGFWGRGKAVLVDARFWKQQCYLALRMTLGLALAIGELSLLGGSVFWILEPLLYRWTHQNFGSWHVDTLGRAFLFVPPGIVGLGIGLALIRPLAAFSGWLVRAFLDETPTDVAQPRWSRATRRRALAGHAGLAAFVGAVVTVVWAATTQGYFWPEWVLLPFGLTTAVHGWVELVAERNRSFARRGLSRALAIHAGAAAALGTSLVVVWAVTSRSYFWPAWPLCALAFTVAIHWVVELARRHENRLNSAGLTRSFGIHAGVWASIFVFEVAIWALTDRGYFWPGWLLLGIVIVLTIHALVDRRAGRERLTRRVERLETTRAGAVEEQDAELQRIERNLHDGAQARLVALGMNLGMAEQKFQSDPEGARQLLAEARTGVAEALRELRDLARGVYPPVLSDRGLGAALASLADRSPLETAVDADLEERPPAQVEAAAYFVAAEALANAAKHSGASRVSIAVSRSGDTLAVEVADDGRGDADPAGSGLIGLRRRVEALDGTLTVSSPPGGPTVVRAEVPCAS
jgi:signal transduction histidine kinase